MEASGGTGVEINPWKSFVDRGWISLYKRISYRKLTCKRDAKFTTALSDFINVNYVQKDNNGKKYEITMQKLLKFQSIIPGVTESRQEPIGKYESFFCSELVAAAYKACGLTSKEKACSQYWPVTFSDKQTIDFLGGAKLEVQLRLETNGYKD